MSAAVDRPLAVRFGAMGDMVMFTAALARLSRHHGAPVDVLTNAGGSTAILRQHPAVGRVWGVKHRKLSWFFGGFDAGYHQAAAMAPTHAYLFDHDRGLERLLAHSGCRIARRDIDYPFGVHYVDTLHDTIDRWGIPTAEPPDAPSLLATAEERQAALALLAARGVTAPPLVVQVGSSRTMRALHRWRRRRNTKAWPVASWSALLTRLSEQHPALPIVFAGAPPEAADIAEVIAALPAAMRACTVDLSRDLPVRTLCGLLAEAAACISVDTGPAHAAAALGCPLVVLFGPADHRECRPRGPGLVEAVVASAWCSPCHGTPRVKTCNNNICMQGIQVETVLAAWNRLAIGRS